MDINEKKLKNLKKLVYKQLKKSQNIHVSITYDIYPKVNDNIWTKDLISYFLKKMDNFIVLGSTYHKYVILETSNPKNIKSNDGLLSYILEEKFDGYTDFSEFEDYLSKIDFISKKLPNSYKTNKESLPFLIENDEIISKKLYEQY